ncbi:MAG: MarR family transcriptional regulator [Thermoproteus sp.]
MKVDVEKLGIQLDDKELRILLSILENEPITAYKIAVDNRMHFSYVYKKIDIFEREELVAYFCEPGSGRKLYYILPKGVLTLMAYGAVTSRKLLADKLRDKWNLKDFSDDEIIAVADLALRNYKPGMPINDVVMLAYTLYNKYLTDGLEVRAQDRILLNKLFRRAFGSLMGLLGEECLQKCWQDLMRRDYI